MTREEKIVLLEIDSLYKKMLQEPDEKRIGNYMQKPNGYNYTSNARKMKTKIFELYGTYKPDYLTETSIGALEHTFNKEILHVEDYYSKSIKNNSPIKRKAEFLDSLSKANTQIKIDIDSVFAKINEVLNDLES
ncbi:hypothetical protein OAA06_01230 [bacterium]|nr:hypothetical protein [bacterium]